MIRKRKKFEWPRKLYDKIRILEENKLLEKYGLKNKSEVWKAEAKIKYFRSRAKSLIIANQEEQKIFFNKLNKIGLKVNSIADVLALNKEDLLKRRLPSILVDKKLANTPKEARQMVTHKRVKVKNTTINVPSYLVKVGEENFISIERKTKKPKNKYEQATVQEMKENKEEAKNFEVREVTAHA